MELSRLRDHYMTQHGSYRPDIDGLRAIAVMAVVLFHAFPDWLPSGLTGVDVFFVISGFLISSIILNDLSKGAFSFAKFYMRRAKRIFPALIVVLCASGVIGWLVLLPHEFAHLGLHTAVGAGFLLNVLLYRELDGYFHSMQPLVHLWSLGVEEQFYFLWPLFLTLIWRAAVRWRLLLLLSVTALSLTLQIALQDSDPFAAFYLPTTRLWELSAGAALGYIQLTTGIRSPSLYGHLLCTLGAACLVVSFTGLYEHIRIPWTVAPVLGALLLIYAGPHAWINRFVLANPLMVGIGLISYPLYLWHWPLLTFVQFVVGAELTPRMAAPVVLASVLLAILTYEYVEKPIRSSTKLRLVSLRLGTAMAACALVGTFSYLELLPSRSVDTQVVRFESAAAETFPPVSSYEWMRMNRLLTLGNGQRRVLFIGDSNVFQYYPLLEKLVTSHPSDARTAVIAARGSCAVGAIEIADLPDWMKSGCKTFLAKALKFAQSPDVDTVVIGGAWYGYFVPFRDDDHYGESLPLRPESDRALNEMKRDVSALVKNGKRVEIILQTPVGATLDPRRMIRRTVLSPGFTIKKRPLTREALDAAIGPVDEKLRSVARETGAHVIDPVEELCDARMCPIVSPEGEPMYHDVAHLLPSYVRDHVRYLDSTLLD